MLLTRKTAGNSLTRQSLLEQIRCHHLGTLTLPDSLPPSFPSSPSVVCTFISPLFFSGVLEGIGDASVRILGQNLESKNVKLWVLVQIVYQVLYSTIVFLVPVFYFKGLAVLKKITKEMYLNAIKAKNSTIINNENLKSFPLRSGRN